MQPTDDSALLRQYVETRSDVAFAALVARHVNLVYSVALRCVGDPHQAEEIAQSVFILLANKAGTLRHDKALSSWLFQTTRLTASNFIRSETRRYRRELEAHMQSQLNQSGDDLWPRIAPLLDEAVADLSDPDRQAILLRFYEGRSLREVGAALDASEDAAQKRVNRAVERLREIFAQRGVTVGASGLVVVISANAVQAAPVGLAVTISTAAVLAGAAINTTTSATVTQTLAMTATKKILIAAALAVAVGTGIYEARQAAALRNQITALQQQTAVTEQLMSDRDDAMRQLAALRAENGRLEGNTTELIKLRGEVTGLRREAAKVRSLESELAKVRSATAETIPPGASQLIISNPYLGREAWSDKGADTPHHAFETMLWAGITGNAQRLGEIAIPGDHSVSLKDRPPLMKIKGVQIVSVDGAVENPGGVTRIGAIVEEEFYGGGLDKPPGIVQNIRSWYLVQTNGEWKVTGGKHSW